MNNHQKSIVQVVVGKQDSEPLQLNNSSSAKRSEVDLNGNDSTAEITEARKPSLCQRLCGCQLQFCREVVSECRQVDCSGILKRSFSLKTLKRRLPIIKWLPKYRLQYLQGDIIAGITVGLTIIPQSLAYAKIAELPPQYGLYTAFMAGFVYCIFGTSKDANIGPAAIMSLLTAEFGRSVIEGDATYAIALSLVCGLVQTAMGFLHIGFLVEYISHPVINSFTTAAAITIACSQLKKWLGLHGIPRGFIPQVTTILYKLPETHLPDFGLGLGCMILLFLLKKVKDIGLNGVEDSKSSIIRNIVNKIIFIVCTARNAIVVILASGLAAILYSNNQVPFTLTGNITAGIPPIRPPQFSITHENRTYTTMDMLHTMGLGIIMAPVVGVIEVIAIGKAFGRKNGYNVEANQELLATGFSNILGSFVSAYPVAASFARTAVNSQSGCATPIAGVITAAIVLVALAVLTPLFFYIPDAALAAVIIMAIVGMIDFSMLKHLWHISRSDMLPWFTTFFVSLGVGFEFGIILGVATSLAVLLYPWARPPLQITSYSDCKENKSTNNGDKPVDILLLNVSMGLMFPGIEHLQEKIANKAFRKKGSSSVIVDFSSVHRLDYTSALGIEQLMEDFAKHEAWLVFINVQPGVLDTLERAEVTITHEETLEDAVRIIRTRRPPDDLLSNVVVVPPSMNGDAPSPPTNSDDQTGWSVVDVSTHCLSQRRRSRSDSNASHVYKLSID